VASIIDDLSGGMGGFNFGFGGANLGNYIDESLD
jgi:hypothetical protein